MSKKILISSTDLMMAQFLLPHVKNLSENGFIVDIACSNVGGKIDFIAKECEGYINNFHIISSVRNPFSAKNLKGYKDIKNVIAQNEYDYIWTNEPVMGVITRLAARKKRKQGLLKVLYMAHGFHFFKGAPLINWSLFYPVEYLTSFLTDCLVTVNHEDFNRAKNFYAKQVKYIHGIGINTDRLNPNSTTQIRDELNLDKNSFLILSVGELNKNKNQQTIIKAFAKINNQNMHYVLCGKGDQEDNLRKLTEQLNLSNRVHFLGYRTDVVNICAQSDVFVMPSLREGLPVASLEAMYCGLPLITSNIRGLVDIMQDGVSGYLCKPTDVNAFSTAIINLFNNKELQISAKANNTEIVKPYLLQNTKTEVLDILKNL
jgi:glycosyltransferase EpsD